MTTSTVRTAQGRFVGWTLLLCVALIGCGSSTGRVPANGSVTLDGQPLSNGEIVFVPTAGTNGPTAAGEIVDGNFDIPAAKGPLPGTYRVEITAERKTGRKIQADEASSEMVDQYEQYIPARYNEDSELSATIAQDAGPLSFELKLK